MTAEAVARLDTAKAEWGVVMVNDHTDGRRHLKVYKDDGGHYVRIGKRGTVKLYLTTERTIVQGLLYEYGYRTSQERA